MRHKDILVCVCVCVSLTLIAAMTMTIVPNARLANTVRSLEYLASQAILGDLLGPWTVCHTLKFAVYTATTLTDSIPATRLTPSRILYFQRDCTHAGDFVRHQLRKRRARQSTLLRRGKAKRLAFIDMLSARIVRVLRWYWARYAYKEHGHGRA